MKQYTSEITQDSYDKSPVLEIETRNGRTEDTPVDQRIKIERRLTCINWDEEAVPTLNFRLTEIKGPPHNRKSYNHYFSIATEDLKKFIQK